MENYRSKQGFYIYRNERLIVWGTWFNRHRDELTKYARVRVDIPNSLDDIWGIDIKKQSATIPPSIRKRLTKDEALPYLDMILEEIESNVPYQQIYIDKSQNIIDEAVSDERIADIEAKAEMMIQLAMSAGATDRSSVIDRLFCSEPFCNFTQLKNKLKENS